MPVSSDFLRGFLGVLGIGCAYYAGRSVAATPRKPSQIGGWVFRTVLCLVGVAFRNPLDAADVAIWSLAALAFAAALWNASRASVRDEP